MKIALISLNQAWEEKSKNLKRCEKQLKIASGNEASLAVFPEMTLTGYSLRHSLAESFEESQSVKEFSNLARKYSISIIFGMSVTNGIKLLNRLVYLGKDGGVLGFYDKIHPFTFANEDQFFDSGTALVSKNIEDINTAFSICYDLRFPEIFSLQAASNELFINIANWPGSRIDHFVSLLKARAIENQAFAIGVNRIGTDGRGVKYSKSSVCFDPYGVRLKPIFASRELDIIEIDKSIVQSYRKKFTAVKDKKFELYKDQKRV